MKSSKSKSECREQTVWCVLCIHHSYLGNEGDVEQPELFQNKADADHYICTELIEKIEKFMFDKEVELKDLQEEYRYGLEPETSESGEHVSVKKEVRANSAILKQICNHICVYEHDIDHPIYSYRLTEITIRKH
jgi:hypothetical protein